MMNDNFRGKPLTPLHEDKALNGPWWIEQGFLLGTEVFYNTIRDASGRYDGFVFHNGTDHITVRTVSEALAAIRLRELGNV